jgi:nitrogen fixation protein FixH
MSLWLSIFGGMTLTALLYGAGRSLRLSNFWSSVLACGLPTLAYLGYAFVTWPGLDVVTLHVVAYPTVAVLLYQLYGVKANHAQSLHWAPKLMIAFFLGLTLVFGTLVYIAGEGLPPALAQLLLPNAKGKNLHTGFAGVVAHKGDDAAKGLGAYLRNEQKLRELGWRVEIDGLSGLKSGVNNNVTVRIADPQGKGVDQASVSVALARPGDKPGAAVHLNSISDGAYHAQLTPGQAGTWVVFLTLVGAGKTVNLEHTVEIE